MTGKDSQPEDDAGRPGDGEDSPETLPDGGSDGSGDSHGRTDGSGETNAGFPGAGDERTDARTNADGGRRTGAADFAGFSFDEWMDDEDIAPDEPAEPAGATAESRATSAGLLALFPFAGSEQVESGPEIGRAHV